MAQKRSFTYSEELYHTPTCSIKISRGAASIHAGKGPNHIGFAYLRVVCLKEFFSCCWKGTRLDI